MKAYKLIGFDMFQTLVDLESQKTTFLKGIFRRDYTREKGTSFRNDANAWVCNHFYRTDDESRPFTAVREVFSRCYTELFAGYGPNGPEGSTISSRISLCPI